MTSIVIVAAAAISRAIHLPSAARISSAQTTSALKIASSASFVTRPTVPENLVTRRVGSDVAPPALALGARSTRTAALLRSVLRRRRRGD
jgi:hypothetical protein